MGQRERNVVEQTSEDLRRELSDALSTADFPTALWESLERWVDAKIAAATSDLRDELKRTGEWNPDY